MSFKDSVLNLLEGISIAFVSCFAAALLGRIVIWAFSDDGAGFLIGVAIFILGGIVAFKNRPKNTPDTGKDEE